MNALVVIVPVVAFVSINALAVLVGRTGGSSAHDLAFRWGLTSLAALPLAIVSLAFLFASLFRGGQTAALVFSGLFGLLLLAGTAVAGFNALRVRESRPAA
jgi:hypothetical protein